MMNMNQFIDVYCLGPAQNTGRPVGFHEGYKQTGSLNMNECLETYFPFGKAYFRGAMLVSRRVKLHSFLPKPKNNSSKLTSQWKITILNRRYIFKWLLFHHHFSFRGCKTSFRTHPAQKGDFWEMSSRNPKTSAPNFFQLAFVHLAGDAQLA